ncbi:hypothetical protein HYDPIDRAFT_30833 [Hydnomerulius pinastri MD-312]|uniref:F-box domain-containing protein n=1 Tax=Hydnomerulius pinastri MD-312 TaxID=994086 RepID=A0A0C9W5L1_9AGAM|nr:hypothetical protein HYDPIDRAFT_30833 [Hydnomerulius pinastri MD-312]
MHNALLVAEVFTYILECLAQDTLHAPSLDVYTNGTGWGALAALARTCHALSDPAIDLLWRRLHSLEPLVQCLRGVGVHHHDFDSDLPSFSDAERTRRAHRVRRLSVDSQSDRDLPPFSDEEWRTLQRYTPRVRELTIDKRSEELCFKVLRSLVFRTTLLLPNLRRLRFLCRENAAMAYIRPLLTPTITHLDVSFGVGYGSVVLDFLQGYHTLCPNLTSIRFHYQGMNTKISTAICRAQSLESIDCGLIDDTALTHIARSLTLKKFSTQLYHIDSHRILRDIARDNSPDLPPFRNVKVINLHLGDLSFIIPFLKPHHQSFTDVSLTFFVTPTTAILHSFFSALGSSTRQGSVRRVHLLQVHQSELDRRWVRPDHWQPLTYDSLCPLQSFTCLRELVLELDNPVSLEEENLMMLARAWPRLEVLQVNYRSGWRVDSSTDPVTLNGLVSLLRLCPMLCTLGLSFDAREVPLPSLDPLASTLQVPVPPSEPSEASAQQGLWGIRNTRLKILNVSDSPIKDPTSVARFLAEVFPSLIEVGIRNFHGAVDPSTSGVNRE